MKAKFLLLSLMAAVAVMFPGRRADAGTNCYIVTGVTEHDCACNGNTTHEITYFDVDYVASCGTKWTFSLTTECPGPGGPCYIGHILSRDCTFGECVNQWDGDGDGWGKECCGGGDCDDTNSSIHPGADPYCATPGPYGYDRNCNGVDDYWDCGGQTCSICTTDTFCGHNCYPLNGCVWGQCDYPTPIVIDVQGNGFNLTDAPGGVTFDLSGDGTTERVAWTEGGSDDAWLALDGDGDGKIDSGQELFGNTTGKANGFLALAEFDRPSKGGNGDGQIDSRDSVFSALRLWQDSNHNGVSEPGELHTLPDLGIASLDLDYKESKRADEHGNKFRYRAKVKDVHGVQVGRWAWDVIPVLVKQ
jgi:hypothetical protein